MNEPANLKYLLVGLFVALIPPALLIVVAMFLS